VTQWKAPGTFLEDDMNRYEQPPLAPPQTYELYNLSGFDSLESLLTECNERQKLDAECWMPVYRVCHDTVLLLLPGVCLVCDSFLVLLFVILMCSADLIYLIFVFYYLKLMLW